MNVSVNERTGWRDERISTRHRTWGKGFLFTDIDGIWVECKSATPVALIEYKMEKDFNPDEWQYSVLVNLGNMAKLPIFFVKYSHDFTYIQVKGLNKLAINFMEKRYNVRQCSMKEEAYIEFEAAIREP